MPYLGTNYDLPFQSGSETSHDAAVAAESFADTQRARYFHWLSERPSGGTDGEAEVELAMRRSSVCARRNELRKRGLVLLTDARRAGCAVWKAV